MVMMVMRMVMRMNKKSTKTETLLEIFTASKRRMKENDEYNKLHINKVKRLINLAHKIDELCGERDALVREVRDEVQGLTYRPEHLFLESGTKLKAIRLLESSGDSEVTGMLMRVYGA